MTDIFHLAAALADHDDAATPFPVEQWCPPYCGEIDIHIAMDGAWYHEGTRIARPALIRLLARLLIWEDGAYFLVTPAEKLKISVVDVPFLAVHLEVSGKLTSQCIRVKTHLGHQFDVSLQHPICLRQVPAQPAASASQPPSMAPYVHVYRDLYARLSRAVYFELVDLLCEKEGMLGVWSTGHFFPLYKAQDGDAL